MLLTNDEHIKVLTSYVNEGITKTKYLLPLNKRSVQILNEEEIPPMLEEHLKGENFNDIMDDLEFHNEDLGTIFLDNIKLHEEFYKKKYDLLFTPSEIEQSLLSCALPGIPGVFNPMSVDKLNAFIYTYNFFVLSLDGMKKITLDSNQETIVKNLENLIYLNREINFGQKLINKETETKYEGKFTKLDEIMLKFIAINTAYSNISKEKVPERIKNIVDEADKHISDLGNRYTLWEKYFLSEGIELQHELNSPLKKLAKMQSELYSIERKTFREFALATIPFYVELSSNLTKNR
jgi:hypothetical protein